MAPMTPSAIRDAWDTFSKPIAKAKNTYTKGSLNVCLSPYLNRLKKRVPCVPCPMPHAPLARRPTMKQRPRWNHTKRRYEAQLMTIANSEKLVRVRLADGLHCEFHLDPENGPRVEWFPEPPRPMPKQIRRRYIEARDRAYRTIAKRLGGPVVVLDTENGGSEIAPILSTIHPDGRIERHTLYGRRVH